MRFDNATSCRIVLDSDNGSTKSVFTIRQLSYLDLAEARKEAGLIPWRGKRIADSVESARVAALRAEVQARGPEGVPFAAALAALSPEDILEVDRAASRAAEMASEALTPDEEAAVLDADEWSRREALAVVRRGVVEVDGSPFDPAVLELVRPVRLYERVLYELRARVAAFSDLDAEKKSAFAERYGPSSTASGADGPALSAPTPAP